MIHGFRAPILCRCDGDATCETALVGASPPPPRLGDHGSVVIRVKNSNIIWTERGKLTAKQTDYK